MKHIFWSILAFATLFCSACGSEKSPVKDPGQTEAPPPPPAPNIEQKETADIPATEKVSDVLIKEKTKLEQEVTSKPVKVPQKLETPKSGAPSEISRELMKQSQSLKRVEPADKTPASNGFSEVLLLDNSIRLDIRYATSDNFTKTKIYDCSRCFLRPEAAEALVKAHKTLKKKGLGLKMFDCYRPRPYQQRLWDKVPDPNYVTPPHKGSMHSRGAAVDLTIIDDKGKELDMGTEYDFFGVEAHTDYLKHPPKILENRKLLTETLAAVGFKGIRTEWWHFSFQGKDYPLSDYVWPCK